MKDHRKLTPRQEAAAEEELYRAVLSLRDTAECRAFFQDLCTPAELQALKDRWAVVESLADGLSYRQVHDRTGVSTATVTRVGRALKLGADGYRLALGRLARKGRKR